MDKFQQYLESLPRPNNPKDREFLDAVMQPYIVRDTLYSIMRMTIKTNDLNTSSF